MTTFPTIEEANKLHPLAPCVLAQLGGDEEDVSSAIDAAEHGADGGFSGFIYNDECRDFVRANKTAIKAALSEMARDLGDDAITMIRGFGCLTDKRKPRSASIDERSTVSADEVGSVLYGDGSDAGDAADMIYSALAWFALEEVGRAIQNVMESE